jgi:hypothetical protein
VPVITLGRSGERRFSVTQATGVSPPRSIKQSSNQAIKQEGVFITEEQGRTIERTKKQRFWRFAHDSDQTPREAQQLAYSVDSIFLPCSSVIETPFYLLD